MSLCVTATSAYIIVAFGAAIIWGLFVRPMTVWVCVVSWVTCVFFGVLLFLILYILDFPYIVISFLAGLILGVLLLKYGHNGGNFVADNEIAKTISKINDAIDALLNKQTMLLITSGLCLILAYYVGQFQAKTLRNCWVIDAKEPVLVLRLSEGRVYGQKFDVDNKVGVGGLRIHHLGDDENWYQVRLNQAPRIAMPAK